MKTTMRLDGGVQLAKALSQMSTRVSKPMLRNALATIVAPPIQNRAESFAPRAPGAPDLAEHVVVVATSPGRGSTAAVVVGPSAETRSDQEGRTFAQQGLFQEFGTGHNRAQPFLRPAFDLEAARTLGAFASAMWEAIAARGISTRGSSSGGGLL